MKINTGIEESQRKEIALGLSKVLADSYTLYLKTHNYHWNVTGPMFHTLHTMFEDQYAELAPAVDVIAERIRALGERAPGSHSEYTKLTSIKEEESTPSAREMIANILTAQECLIKTARGVFPVAEKASDEATVDILTQRIQQHEKMAWMLRSLLED